MAFGAAAQTGVLSEKQDTSKIVLLDASLLTTGLKKMVNDAEEFANEDTKLRSKVEVRSELEKRGYSLKSQLTSNSKRTFC